MATVRQRPPRAYTWILIAATSGYVAVFFALLALEHAAFQTGYDLAGVLQEVWAIASHQEPFNTFWGMHNWANHLYLFAFHLAPLYRLLPSVHLLFLVQTLALALGAPVIYRLAFDHLKHPGLSLALAVAYLASPLVHSANLYDVHWDTLAPVFLLLMLALAPTHRPAMLLVAMLAMMTKETTAVSVVAIGAYVACGGMGHDGAVKRGGLLACVVGLLWFFTAVWVVVPSVNAGRPSPNLAHWTVYGDSPTTMIRSSLADPTRTLSIIFLEHKGLVYLLQVTATLLFLPWLAPEVLLLAAPTFVPRFLCPFDFVRELEYHYPIQEVPVLFYAAIIGARRLLHARPRGWLRHRLRGGAAPWPLRVPRARALQLAVWLSLPVSVVAFSHLARAPWKEVAEFAASEEARTLRELCRQIPPEAGVSASVHLTPHFATRRVAYMFPNPYQRVWWTGRPGDAQHGQYVLTEEPTYDLRRGHDVDYVIVKKVVHVGWRWVLPPEARDFYEPILAGLKRSGDFEVLRDDVVAVVLRRVRAPRPSH